MNPRSIRLDHWELLRKSLVWAYSGPVPRYFQDHRSDPYHVTLWHLKIGQLKLNWRGGQLEAQTGDWVLIPPMPIHQVFSKHTEILSIRFILNTFSDRCLLAEQGPTLLRPANSQLMDQSEVLIHNVKTIYGNTRFDLYRAESSIHDHVRLNICFLKFLEAFFDVLPPHQLDPVKSLDERLHTCIWHIQNSPLSRKYSEADMAALSGVSVSHINRLFMENFNMTSKAWLDGFRYTESKQLLERHQPIKEVAYALGFSSPQHFSSWFRKRSGHTPKAWRSQSARI